MISSNLADIAIKLNAELKGDPQCVINRIDSLAQAQPGAITFLANSRHRPYLATTQASAVILSADDLNLCPTNALIVANPELTFAQLLAYYCQPPLAAGNIHPTAVIGEGCQIDATAQIGAHCVIADRVQIGERTIVEAGTLLGSDSVIGSDSHLYPRVTLYSRVRLGHRVIIHSGAVLGADGFGFAQDQGKWMKIIQLGGVLVGDDVEIGANTTIDRGAIYDTVIGHGVKIDNLVQIAHNVKIGDHTAIAGCVGIAGSTEIGKYCMIGGAVDINGHIKITDRVMVTGSSSVAQSILEPGVYSSGIAIEKNRVWRRNMLRFSQLDEMAKRLRRLEKLHE